MLTKRKKCLLYMNQHRISRLFLSAKERYLQLIKELPDVIQQAKCYRFPLGIILLLSLLSYYRFEKPMNKLIKRILNN